MVFHRGFCKLLFSLQKGRQWDTELLLGHGDKCKLCSFHISFLFQHELKTKPNQYKKLLRQIVWFWNSGIVLLYFTIWHILLSWQKHYVTFTKTVARFTWHVWSQSLSHFWFWGSQTVFINILKFHNCAVGYSLLSFLSFSACLPSLLPHPRAAFHSKLIWGRKDYSSAMSPHGPVHSI